jgi:transcriptional regulator with XRE-family HTH domain
MTPTQLRRLIKSAGLTVQAAANELGMTNRQLYRYLSGDAEIPRVVELAVRWIVQDRKKS